MHAFGHAVAYAGQAQGRRESHPWLLMTMAGHASERLGTFLFTLSVRLRTSFILVMHRMERCGIGRARRA